MIKKSRRFNFRLIITLFVYFSAGFSNGWASEGDHHSLSQKKTLYFASGPSDGIYFQIAALIAEEVSRNHPDYKIIVLPTSSHLENLHAVIHKDSTGIALLQSDNANFFFKQNTNLRLLAPLFDESLHIVVQKTARIQELDDLRGGRVSVGTEGSGTHLTVQRMFNSLGIYPNSIDYVFRPYREAFTLLRQNKIEACILLSGAPDSRLLDMPENIGLLSLSKDQMDEIVRENIGLNSRDQFVDRRIYPWLDRNIMTVKTSALLVCHQNMDRKSIRLLLETIYSSDKLNAKLNELQVKNPVKRIAMNNYGIPLHKSAKKYFHLRKLLFMHQISKWAWDILLLLIIAALISSIYSSKNFKILVSVRNVLGFKKAKPPYKTAVFLQRLRNQTKGFCKNVEGKITITILGLYVVTTVILHLYEHNNPGYYTLKDAFWSSSVFILSGMESNIPTTTGGKISAIFLLFANVGIIGSVFGIITTTILGLRKGIKMRKNHILICNWGSDGERIISELLAKEANVYNETNIVVLAENRAENEKDLRLQSDKYDHVDFVPLDPVLHSSLEKVGAQYARAIIVLADYSAPDPDAKSALICLAARDVFNRYKTEDKPNISQSQHIVVQSINHKKINHILSAGADEVVCANDYGLGVLSQCTLNKGLSKVYKDLLTYSGNTNEIYILDPIRNAGIYPAEIVKKSFHEASQLVYSRGGQDNPAVLLGAIRKNENGEIIYINPRGVDKKSGNPSFGVFKETDAIIVMAYHCPNLGSCESK